MLRDHLGATVPELVQKARRALDVRGEQRDGSAGKLPHADIIARRQRLLPSLMHAQRSTETAGFLGSFDRRLRCCSIGFGFAEPASAGAKNPPAYVGLMGRTAY